MNKNKVVFSIMILIIDQITKYFIQTFNTVKVIIPNFFKITYYQNTGAAWSILEGHQTLLIIVSIIMLILVYNMMFSYKENKINDIAFGLLFGGILGNLIDRIMFAYVRDFISLKILGYSFPVFNIADISIVVGISILVITLLKGELKNGISSRRKRNTHR